MNPKSVVADHPNLSSVNFSSSRAEGTEYVEYVEAELNYLKPMQERPYNYTYVPNSTTQLTNTINEFHRLRVWNGRSLAPELSLDRQGFSFISHTSAVQDFYDDRQIRQIYFPEAERLVKAATGAARVLVFDYNLRNALKAQQVAGVKEPVQRVHNDFTAKSGYRRSRDELAALGLDNPEELLQHRFSIINVWKPIERPVEAYPLAVCDARSITATDWVASDLIYSDRVGETYLTTYNPAHQWFYFPQMQTDEILLIKCFDSAVDIPARFTAHTAFVDPTSPPRATPRASIELRTLVLYAD